MPTGINQVGEWFQATAGAAVELAQDFVVLAEAAQDLERAKRLRAASFSRGECREEVSQGRLGQFSTERVAEEAAHRAKKSLDTLGAKYRHKINGLWAKPKIVDGVVTEDATKIYDSNLLLNYAKSKTSQTQGSQGLEATRVVEESINELEEESLKLVSAQADQTARLGLEALEEGAEHVVQIVGDKSRYLLRTVDSYIPEKLKWGICASSRLVPNPWTIGACMLVGYAGLSTAREDYEKNPNLNNGLRIVRNGLMVGSALLSSASLVTGGDYGAAGSGMGNGDGEGAYPLAGGARLDGAEARVSFPPQSDSLTDLTPKN